MLLPLVVLIGIFLQQSYAQVPAVSLTQTSYSVNAGGQVTLACSVTSSSAVNQVFWQRNVNGFVSTITSNTNTNKYSGSSASVPGLTILNADGTDQGIYQCFASNAFGTGQSSTIAALTVSSSCQDIYMADNRNSNGNYVIHHNGSAINVYCSFESNYGYTYISKQSYNTELNISLLYTTLDFAKIRHRKSNGIQKEVIVENLSSFQSRSTLYFGYNANTSYEGPDRNNTGLKPYLFLGFLPESFLRNYETQGYRTAGKDFTFKNCDKNPNSYITFYYNPNNTTPGRLGNTNHFMMGWMDESELLPMNNYMDTDFYFDWEMHMGGCGGFMTSHCLSNNRAALGLPFSIKPCDGLNCQNGGSCDSSVSPACCICVGNYFGDRCENINGGWTEWSVWSDCPDTCGDEDLTRTRSCTNPAPENNGTVCQGHTSETISCTTAKCPVNGGWTEWSVWSDCPETCGDEYLTRTRSCTNPSPENNGTDCQGSNTETLLCSTAQCPEICGGKVFIPDLGTTVEFLPVKFGLIAISSEICITDKQPLATFKCVGGIGITTKFVDIQVNQKCLFGDLSTSAVTDTLRNLTEVNIDENTVNKVLETLRNLTSDPTPLTSIDIIDTAEILVKASNVSNLNEKALTDIIDTINSFLSVEPETIKLAQEDGSASNRILEVIDTIPRFLDLQGQPGIRWVRDNILMEVYDISALSSTVFGIQIEGGGSKVPLTNSTIQNLINGSNINLETVDAAIILPVELINKFPNATRISFNVYRNWNLFSVRSDVRQYLPNSRVIASSIFIDGLPVRSLGEYEVQTLFYPTADVESSICGYWNYDLYDTSGGWATDGCQLNKTEYGRYVCVCDHLTNFAVIVNIGGQDNLVESLAMDIISWIGLILSIIGLSLTIVLFIVFKHLRKGRVQQTLFNLALSLLSFLIIFIVGIGQTQDLKGCIAVAVLLHYFILVAFMWMLMEGILQYLRFVKVLGTYIPNFILKTAVPAWGIPLIPVIIVLAYDHELYIGGNKACWMSLSAFYYAFVIPVGIIILANIIIFIMILKNLWGRPKGLQSNQSEKKRAMMNLRASLTVLVLIGLTWIFGFFTIEKASIVFQYIFTILNVFQGFIIFILFTAREKRVRQNWQKLCCKRTTKEKYLQSDTNTDRNRSKDRLLTSSTNDDTKYSGEDQNTSSCI
ncbi:adhesion G protein-coupled receptor B1-like [Mytilus trossulus]|uniref:adhesion G protein-coupled receptor B1-like n=1 Tax=Mytilus trossulus TaxID=6551 RepID=UPI003004F82D